MCKMGERYVARGPSQALVADADSEMPPRPSGQGLLEVGLGRRQLSQVPGDSNSRERLRTRLEYKGIRLFKLDRPGTVQHLPPASSVSCDMQPCWTSVSLSV